MNKSLMQTIRIIHNYCYQEYLESSGKKLFRSLSDPIGDVTSIGYNSSVDWIWSPLIPMSSYYLSPIIPTSLAYIEMNNVPYTLENRYLL